MPATADFQLIDGQACSLLGRTWETGAAYHL